VAGVAVTGSTLAWTAGAWIQARLNDRWEGRRLIRIGLVVILCGIAGLTTVLSSDVAVIVGIVAWTVAGLGMGLAFAPITLLMLDEAPAGRQGWASASLNLADVLGSALGIGLGGAAIGAAARFGWSLAAGLAAAFALTVVAGLAALAISRQLPVRRRPAGTGAPVTASQAGRVAG
jgi:MFS family permease